MERLRRRTISAFEGKPNFLGVSTPCLLSDEELDIEMQKISIFKRKAMDSRLMRDTFKYSDTLLSFIDYCGGVSVVFKSNWRKLNNKAWLYIQSEFNAWLLLMIYHKQESEGASWGYIFYKYLVNFDWKHRNILTKTSMVNYSNLISAFFDFIPKPLFFDSQELYEFFETHKEDPYSAIIGLPPHKNILKESMEMTEEVLENIKENFNHITDDNNEPLHLRSSFKSLFFDLIKKLSKLSTIRADRALYYLQLYVGKIRCLNKLKIGSLVLVEVDDDDNKTDGSIAHFNVEFSDQIDESISSVSSLLRKEGKRWIYGRIAGNITGNTVAVYINSMENSRHIFTLNRILPLSNQTLLRYFSRSSPDELEKCVDLRSDEILLEFMSHCKLKSREFLYANNKKIKDFNISNEIEKKSNLPPPPLSPAPHRPNSHPPEHDNQANENTINNAEINSNISSSSSSKNLKKSKKQKRRNHHHNHHHNNNINNMNEDMLEVIQLAKKNQCNFRHLELLKSILRLLDEIPASFYESVNSKYQNLVLQFENYQKNNPFDVFYPTAELRLQQLREFDSETAMRSEIKQIRGVCELAIEEINIQKMQFIKQSKVDLINRWKSIIHSKSLTFLSPLGYQEIGDVKKYISEKPNSDELLLIKKNLVILKRILTSFNSSNDHLKVKYFLINICQIIYPINSGYCQDIKYFICFLLKISNSNFSSHYAKTIAKQNFDESTQKVVSELLSVRSQLKKLQKEEFIFKLQKSSNSDQSQNYANYIKEKINEYRKSIKTSSFLPISWLILSEFSRLESECTTILDLWLPTAYNKLENSRTPLEQAVIKGDIKQIESLIKSGQHHINEVDDNGWSVLHLSCSFCYSQSHLDVTKFLLDNFPELNTALGNKLGNSPFHYFVKLPISSSEIPPYIQLLKSFLSSNPLLAHLPNSSGETPLHCAVLASNQIAVRELLLHLADPNFQNSSGESSLHLAVQSQNIEITTLLLQNGANVAIKNLKGEDAFDVAAKLNYSEIAEILIKESNNSDDQKNEAEKRKKARIQCLSSLSSLPSLPSFSSLENINHFNHKNDINFNHLLFVESKPTSLSDQNDDPDHEHQQILTSSNNNNNNSADHQLSSSLPSSDDQPLTDQQITNNDDAKKNRKKNLFFLKKRGKSTVQNQSSTAITSLFSPQISSNNLISPKNKNQRSSSVIQIKSTPTSPSLDCNNDQKLVKSDQTPISHSPVDDQNNDVVDYFQQFYFNNQSSLDKQNKEIDDQQLTITSEPYFDKQNNNNNNVVNDNEEEEEEEDYFNQFFGKPTSSSTKETKQYRIAKWAKSKEEDGELAFEIGDIITVVSSHNSGWWVGTIDNITIGIFPVNYTLPFPLENEDNDNHANDYDSSVFETYSTNQQSNNIDYLNNNNYR